MNRERMVRLARGDEPVDLLLTDAAVVNVFAHEVVATSVAIAGSWIVGLGEYPARETLSVGGAYVAPGFIDAHAHVESAMVPPSEFGRAVVPMGTTTVVTDPHEIANVHGLEGIRFMLASARGGAMSTFVMAPACVPATHMGTSGAALTAADLAALRDSSWVLGLAEVMNFPAVVAGDPAVLAKLEAFADRVVDGHCPGLSGLKLNAYVAAGIQSDHESTTIEEAREKLRAGLTLLVREATNARNLRQLLPLVTPENCHRFCFCTDDRTPAHLLDEGHIDSMVRVAIAEGVDPLAAIRMATHNTAQYLRLWDRGAVAPGKRADLVVFADLKAPRPHLVVRGGRVVARDGALVPGASQARSASLPDSMHVDWGAVDFAIAAAGSRARVIGAIPDQLVTEHLVAEPPVADGWALADPSRDLLKMAVIERHRASGAVGLGFIRGFGLRHGAIASSVAHDHHNLVVIGADDVSMHAAARHAAAMGGGIAVAAGERVLAEVPLPLAGLMSDRPIAAVRAALDRAIASARELGATPEDPFMAMSFMALEVIPSLKLTDQGLVDVDAFEIVPLWQV
ncbi:MAG: adenine deaminase [Acidobacteriota bacterium]|nr:adenine deaminase [Acidobacteriota bacterium]MDH3524493.1 adenine deaminase [Acidobacteriota bacterium]